MLENIQTLINILDIVEIEEIAECTELRKLQKLKSFLKLPVYQILFITGEPRSLEEKELIAEHLYNRAVRFYNLKEYQQSFNSIIDSINDAQPVYKLTIKLLIANLHSLGKFAIAGQMYSKYFEITGEVDCLFYAGMCSYMKHDNDSAINYLSTFIKKTSMSVKDKVNYASLIKNADSLIKKMS